MRIREDDPLREPVAGLLREHLASMFAASPPESVHALDAESLTASDITFWACWDGEELLGCGALRELDPSHGEIKSMRTATAHLRRGVASRLLEHILAEAQRRGYRRLSLETGSMREFRPAMALYESYGFDYCDPFGDYIEDPNSLFMTRRIDPAGEASVAPATDD